VRTSFITGNPSTCAVTLLPIKVEVELFFLKKKYFRSAHILVLNKLIFHDVDFSLFQIARCDSFPGMCCNVAIYLYAIPLFLINPILHPKLLSYMLKSG
jgi:hypothetical protein